MGTKRKRPQTASHHRHDYTTVGHVTADVFADGSRRAGGTAFYSALQASRLGLRTRILTRGDPDEIEGLLEPYRTEFELTVLPAARTTTLRTEGAGNARRQRLLAWAGPIAPPAGSAAGATAPPVEVDTAILHLAPVARETPQAWLGKANFVGLTPQGLMREWDATGAITLRPLHQPQLPAHSDAWVLSERERACGGEPLAQALAQDTLVVVTAGARAAELRLPGGGRVSVPAPSIAAPRDDLGAGDVFAAALFVALHEGQDPARAAAFATAAAAVRIAGTGPTAIGDRQAIEARLTPPAPPTPPR